MARKCLACDHELRDDIDSNLVAGGTLRKISRQFGVSVSSLHRHKAKHLPPALIGEHQVKEAERGSDLVRENRDLRKRANRIADDAQAAGDGRVEIAAVKEQRGSLELEGKLTGELKPAGMNVSVGINLFGALDEVHRRQKAAELQDKRRRAMKDITPLPIQNGNNSPDRAVNADGAARQIEHEPLDVD